MITNPYSKFLTPFPHLCLLGTIPANELTYAIPQSWTSQEIPLPQASWNLHIIAVWNTAAHGYTLIATIRHGCRILPGCDIPKANWHLNSIVNDPIRNARHAGTASGFKKFKELHSDKLQTAKCSHKPVLDEVASLSHHSKPGLTLMVADWNSWTYTDGSYHIQEGKQVVGAGVYHPSTSNSNLSSFRSGARGCQPPSRSPRVSFFPLGGGDSRHTALWLFSAAVCMLQSRARVNWVTSFRGVPSYVKEGITEAYLLKLTMTFVLSVFSLSPLEKCIVVEFVELELQTFSRVWSESIVISIITVRDLNLIQGSTFLHCVEPVHAVIHIKGVLKGFQRAAPGTGLVYMVRWYPSNSVESLFFCVSLDSLL